MATFLPGGPTLAQEPTGPEGRPPVKLDRLLELPPSLDYTVERRGGRTAGEWRERFHEIRASLAAERSALADAEGRLEELAGSTESWKVAPALPGVGAPSDEAPLDYGLRQEIRRHRAEIERLERRLRELEIEADLAGVPATWRGGEAQRMRGGEAQRMPIDDDPSAGATR